MSELLAQLRARASKDPKRIVYPEGADVRVLRAAARVAETRMAKPIIVGSPQVVESTVQNLAVSVAGIEIVDPKTLALADRYMRLLLPEWKSRGITELEALKRL